MHRAVIKAATNTALSRNCLRLSVSERDYIASRAGIHKFHIMPGSITGLAVRADNEGYSPESFTYFKYNLINYFPIKRAPFEGYPKFRFLSEIITENKPYHDTELFRYVKSGHAIDRLVDGEVSKERIVISSEPEFIRYYETCASLINSIRKYGYLDLQYGDGEVIGALRSSRPAKGTTIGLAIDQQGYLLHYTKGHHRLAVAMLLQIEKIPVAINYISGTYLERFVSRLDLCSEQRFAAAIKRAVDHAVGAHLIH
jgi:hypothetical protein